jgi:hypothetical protein
MKLKTPYTAHAFGEEVHQRLRSRRGWLTAGIASSIAWPSLDVCVTYAGDDYFLRGSECDGKPSPPGITIACNDADEADEAISKIYRFTSILSWFSGGYVDVSGYRWATYPILHGGRTVYSSMGIAGARSFNCNHLPIIEDDNIRKALAFWREGKRLVHVHDSYSFLSFYKVIESQFRDGKSRGKWIAANIDKLTERAANRVVELRTAKIDVGKHLFESGRCAVAHAALEGEIVDPDVPSDKRRLSADLIIIEELARIYIHDELGVPDSRSLYRTRNRLAPWESLLPTVTLESLKKGNNPDDVDGLDGRIVSIGLWPDGPIPSLERMIMRVAAVDQGLVRVSLINERTTILLFFTLDFKDGRVHTNLEEGGLLYGENEPDENDVRAYATFFYRVFGNGIAELTCEDSEPIDCEVVIPVNMMMRMSAEQAIAEEVERFKQRQAKKNEQ